MYKVNCVLLLLLLPLSVSGQQLDPTRPFGIVAESQGGESSPTLILQSIIQSEASSKAIINGQVLKLGDSYRDFELISINSTGVVLDTPQGRKELSLFSGVIAN
ncbi:hypothetical protein SAMN05216262_104107 [Colwellia chukchiensis]|uniref:MSHA biogenesis protein MshK n=1 Tax=Colwellia chukchiensis TaxID=641665 RepID=A0A1H7LBS0_9GAMM|nr:hypothetical protein [Colwellia chukchiensis]SEK96210.1 hypothetical protein SAMN05216262_104107 [Colwellia chukchiensis]